MPLTPSSTMAPDPLSDLIAGSPGEPEELDVTEVTLEATGDQVRELDLLPHEGERHRLAVAIDVEFDLGALTALDPGNRFVAGHLDDGFPVDGRDDVTSLQARVQRGRPGQHRDDLEVVALLLQPYADTREAARR